jgi:hypothetical protein
MEDYRCVNQELKEQCKTCDGFGRNCDENIDVSKCYISRNYFERATINLQSDSRFKPIFDSIKNR